jgi:hypothetical protein
MHQLPMQLGITEWAELAKEGRIPFSRVLEGLVILCKNLCVFRLKQIAYPSMSNAYTI